MDNELVVEEDLVVTLDYTLRVQGEVVASTSAEEGEPIRFIKGHGQILPALERGLYHMKVGETRHIVIPPREAYGQVDPDAVEVVHRGDFPPGFPIKEGAELEWRDDSGEMLVGRIVSAGKSKVRIDFNHPLAGKELHFEVKVVGLRPATEEEIAHGHVHDAEAQ